MNCYSLSGELLYSGDKENEAFKTIRKNKNNYISHLTLNEYSKNNYNCVFTRSFMIHILVSDVNTGLKHKDWYVIIPNKEGNYIHDNILQMNDDQKNYVFNNTYVYNDERLYGVVESCNNITHKVIFDTHELIFDYNIGIHREILHRAFRECRDKDNYYITVPYLYEDDDEISYEREFYEYMFDGIDELDKSVYRFKSDITAPDKTTRYYISINDDDMNDEEAQAFIRKYNVCYVTDTYKNKIYLCSDITTENSTMNAIISNILSINNKLMNIMNIKKFITADIVYSYKERILNDEYILIESDFEVIVDDVLSIPLLELTKKHMNRNVYSIECIVFKC